MLIALVVAALLDTACLAGAAQSTVMPYVGMFPLTQGDYNVGVVAKVGVEAAFANQNQWLDESLQVWNRNAVLLHAGLEPGGTQPTVTVGRAPAQRKLETPLLIPDDIRQEYRL